MTIRTPEPTAPIGETAKDPSDTRYSTEVLGRADPYSWNAAIHFHPPQSEKASEKPVTVNVSVGSISALLQRFG